MEKVSPVALVSLAICLSSLLSLVVATVEDDFIVEGKVYCDTCRVEFETPLIQPLKGAVVKLECRSRTNSKRISHSKDVVTDAAGRYKITVRGDHAGDICDLVLVKSPRRDCAEPSETWRKSRVVLTKKTGVKGGNRFTNNLGFMSKEPLAECDKVLSEMGYFEITKDTEGHSRDV